MADPDEVSDSMGEWFEITSTHRAAIDLMGLEIYDNDNDHIVIDVPLLLQGGGRAVLGVDPDPADNGGVTLDFSYDDNDLTLGNSSDELVLAVGTVVIDSVAWDGGPIWPDERGESASLDPLQFDTYSNDNGANWCPAVSAYGDGDLGTPGAPNDPC